EDGQRASAPQTDLAADARPGLARGVLDGKDRPHSRILSPLASRIVALPRLFTVIGPILRESDTPDREKFAVVRRPIFLRLLKMSPIAHSLSRVAWEQSTGQAPDGIHEGRAVLPRRSGRLDDHSAAGALVPT